MVTEELNNKESVIVCDFNHQLSVSTQQLGYPYPNLIEDDSCGNKHGCFSEHYNTTTLYTVLEAVHIPMTAAERSCVDDVGIVTLIYSVDIASSIVTVILDGSLTPINRMLR